MSFQEIQVLLDTGLNKVPVGVLAAADQRLLFEYEASWITRSLELAPFYLPVAKRAFVFERSQLPSGLPGLCADSLPDGWGTLIMDRYFLRQGVARQDISLIDRLAYLGDDAMGALCYQPALRSGESLLEAVRIGVAAREALHLFEGKVADAGRLLARIGGSPGGARPKALIGIPADGDSFVSGNGPLPAGYTHWMVKFSGEGKGGANDYGRYEGALEHICLQLARAAGITVPEFKLIDDGAGVRHLAGRRFDRPTHATRRHVATTSGLLHADYRLPSLDYAELLRLAWALTRDSTQVVEQYRRAIFNLFAGNRDDHAKNHGYLMDESGRWQLSPVYDVTFSSGPGGEHWTSFLGVGTSPGTAILLQLAEQASIKAGEARTIIEQVQAAMTLFPSLAQELGIPPLLSRSVAEQLKLIRIDVSSRN